MLAADWIITNHEALKLVLNLILILTCVVIVLRTHKIFKLSEHEGIRYFRNAFFFYGLAFTARYLLSAPYEIFKEFTIPSICLVCIRLVYEFFFVMAGFFLLYSLLWKRFGGKTSSLFNGPIFIFYSLALIISLLDFFWIGYDIMFFSQIIVFSFAGGLAFEKYGQNEQKGFLKSYLTIILLMLASRILHFFVSSFFEWNMFGVIAVYLLDVFIFSLFLYNIVKVTKS